MEANNRLEEISRQIEILNGERRVLAIERNALLCDKYVNTPVWELPLDRHVSNALVRNGLKSVNDAFNKIKCDGKDSLLVFRNVNHSGIDKLITALKEVGFILSVYE